MISDSFQQNSDLKKIQGKYSPFAILLITILGIAVAEVIAMVVVYFQRHLPYYQQVINPSCYQRKLMLQARTKRATLISKPLGVTA